MRRTARYTQAGRQVPRKPDRSAAEISFGSQARSGPAPTSQNPTPTWRLRLDATQLMVRGVVVGLFQANCYIIGSRQTGEAICFDPGDEVDEIKALAREMRVKITRIVCSHGHLDHIMAVRALKEETGAPFLLHRSDLELSRHMPEAALRMLGRVEQPAPDPDAFLADGDDVEITGISLKVLHT